MKKSWCYCRQGKQLLRTAMLHFTTEHIEACAALYFSSGVWGLDDEQGVS